MVEEEGDLFGEAVNAAARISALARGGEILVSSVVKDLVGTLREVIFTDRGLHPLQGFPEEWHLYEVRGQPRVVLPAARTPFVGRQRELAQLRRSSIAPCAEQGRSF